MSKKKAASFIGKSLYDIVATKSKKYIEMMKAPLVKQSLKREFTSRVTSAITAIYESKAREIDMLMNVKNIDVNGIVNENTLRKEIFTEISSIAAIYFNVFGETLEVEITEADLPVSTNDVLAAATDIDEDDED